MSYSRFVVIINASNSFKNLLKKQFQLGLKAKDASSCH